MAKYIFSIVSILFLFKITVAQTDTLIFDVATAENVVSPPPKSEMEVISASRSLKKINDLPITIYVITREEILYNGYTTLVDVLKSLPGIRVSQPGSGELGEIFMMRGFIGNAYAKIMIDGIPVKPSVTIGMPIEAQLPIRQAQRIEVIYGPASAVYGADATAGVINIITDESQKGVYSRSDLSLGENGYSYLNFLAGGKAGKNDKILKYSIFGSKSNTDNLNITNYNNAYKPLNYLDRFNNVYTMPDGKTYTPMQLTPEILDFYNIDQQQFLNSNYEGTITNPEFKNIPTESHNIGFKLNYKNFSLSYQNMMRKTHSSIGKSTYLYKYNDPQNYIGDFINRVTFSYKKDFEHISSTTNLSFLNYFQDNYSNYGVTFVSYTDKLYQYSASNDIFGEQLITYNNKNIEIVSGVSAQLSSDLPYTNYSLEPYNKQEYSPFMSEHPITDGFEYFGFNPLLFQNFSTFIQTYYVYKKVSLMGGIRHDYNTIYGYSLNPRIAYLYKINPKTAIRVSYGRAFRAPAPNMAYNSLSFDYGQNLDSIYYAVIPNKDLKPEKFQAYELGLRKTFNKKVYLDISLYYNKINNQIINSYINPVALGFPLAANPVTEPARTFINSSKTETEIFGGEIYLTIKDIIQPYHVNIEIGLTISQLNEISPEISIDSLKFIPFHSGKIKIDMKPSKRSYFKALTYWSSKWESSLDLMEGMGITDVKGFLDVDIIVGYKLSNNLSMYIKIINFFNENYGGIGGTGYDLDLNINPQLGRNVRFGMTFDMN